MSQYYKQIVAVYLILKKDNQVFLLKRANTGWMDGYYSLPAGHVEKDETAVEAIIRETNEEIGLKLNQNQLSFWHLLHRRSSDSDRIDIFFTCEDFESEPYNNEPEKCSHAEWFPISDLPKKVIDYVQDVILLPSSAEKYSDFGW